MLRQWYAARIRSRAEHAAAIALERLGLEVFSPWVRPVDCGRGGSDEPLFPGYLFVRCCLERDSSAIQASPHVLGLVRFDREAAPLPDGVVDCLRQRVADINDEGGLWTRFKRGDIVRVYSARTETLASVLEEPNSPRARVRVLMRFMGRLVPAQVPFAALRPASPDDSIDGPPVRRGRRTRGGGRWITGISPRAAPAPAG